MSIDFRLVDSYTLAYKIGAILLDEFVEHPGRPVYLQRVLEERSILAITDEVYHAVEKLRARHWDVRAVEREPGYWLHCLGEIFETEFRRRLRRHHSQIPLFVAEE